MTAIRTGTDPAPIGSDVGEEFFRLVSRAGVMGLLDEPVEELLGTEDPEALVAEIRDALVPRGVAVLPSQRLSSGITEGALRDLNDAIEDSPMPAGEWAPLRDVVGDDLLAELCGTSLASLRRYASGSRRTPDEVAERLHTVALVVADLAGSYNDYGIRRWFQRSRAALGGRAPGEVLVAAAGVDDPDVAAVRALAAALVAGGAT